MGTHVHGRLHRTCQEPACREARAKYAKRWRYERSHGKQRTMETDKVRLHIATLMGRDFSARAIAGAAGVSVNTVTGVMNGAPRIRRDIAAKILAVRPDIIPQQPSRQTTEPFVSRVGTVRRLQALFVMQWRAEDLVAYGAPNDRWVYNLLHQQGRWVTRSTHDKVAAIYDQLKDKLGPSPRTRTRALNRGYRGPLDWEDIDRDLEPVHDEGVELDDDVEVDEAAVFRYVRGEDIDLTRQEKYEAVRALFAAGWQPGAVAKRIGWSKDHVVKIRDGERGRKRASKQEKEEEVA